MNEKHRPGFARCCVSSAKGLTYLEIGHKGNRSGMQKLEIVFREMYEAGFHPKKISIDEIIRRVRKFNYIAFKPNIEVDYAEALRTAYTSFYTDQKQKDEKSAQ